jgi:hypothetical protein
LVNLVHVLAVKVVKTEIYHLKITFAENFSKDDLSWMLKHLPIENFKV